LDLRIAGALVGAAVAGVALLGIVAIGENAGWWYMAITWEPAFPDANMYKHDPAWVHLPHHLAYRPPGR